MLRFSGWRYVQLAYSETYEALVDGLQSALFALGGAPEVVRSDNLSAATHELRHSGGRALNARFAAVLTHYGVRSTRIRPGQSHENGAVEQGHYRLKSALAQALVLRGSRDFPSVEAYGAFVQEGVAGLNQRAEARRAEERVHLRPLPPKRVPAYTRYTVRVRRWSTIRISRKTYSVPSRLVGHRVDVHQHADVVEVYYAGKLVERMPRLRGGREHRIDYRHVIWSLVRKPGAFARYRYREELFPTPVFRAAYDALCESRGERADIEYVRILHLVASTLEATVERALKAVLATGEGFDYASVRALAAPEKPRVPECSSTSRSVSKAAAWLSRGGFLERSVNVLAFGLPGTGKSHALCALGHRLVEQGHAVRFAPTYEIVQELLAAKRDLGLPKALRKLDRFELLILDDLGYLKQHADEAEVLFTLIAERYERRSIAVTSNVVFSQWQEIFQSPMATAAAIDRVVHHSAILEFDVSSYRTAAATATRTPRAPRTGGSGRPDPDKRTGHAPGARTRRKAGAERRA